MDEQIRMLAERYAEEHRNEQQELLRALGKLPAPTRREDLRAAFCRDWLVAQGARDVTIDDAKNVVCRLGYAPDRELVVFAAHTDIVFPDLDPLPLREEDGKLFAPGIGDDTANLVNLLVAAKYLIAHEDELCCGVLVVANACEEGLGNLDGTRALFAAYGARIRGFYSFDIYMPLCCCTAVGSARYRITCRTQGGHSYADFGRPSAIQLMCGLVEELYRIQPPDRARTTYNVGRIEGGTTVNSIAETASVLYEYRSTSQDCMAEMEVKFRRAVAHWQDRGGQFTVELLGVRPGNGPVDPAALGRFTDRSDDVIRTFAGCEPEHTPNSTDSNIPLSLGIPANTIGTVRGGLAHTRKEWIALDSLSTGLKIVVSLMAQTCLRPQSPDCFKGIRKSIRP
ncbi:M20/M25/M40 family metallo-hydrolase [Gemmiger sp.]|uniref:M20/M25/M40 family metallo-hydrolase n=1 Tax=Gemmiger sp. TaxID=2049027 RepID=UPI003F0A1B91